MWLAGCVLFYFVFPYSRSCRASVLTVWVVMKCRLSGWLSSKIGTPSISTISYTSYRNRVIWLQREGSRLTGSFWANRPISSTGRSRPKAETKVIKVRCLNLVHISSVHHRWRFEMLGYELSSFPPSSFWILYSRTSLRVHSWYFPIHLLNVSTAVLAKSEFGDSKNRCVPYPIAYLVCCRQLFRILITRC